MHTDGERNPQGHGTMWGRTMAAKRSLRCHRSKICSGSDRHRSRQHLVSIPKIKSIWCFPLPLCFLFQQKWRRNCTLDDLYHLSLIEEAVCSTWQRVLFPLFCCSKQYCCLHVDLVYGWKLFPFTIYLIELDAGSNPTIKTRQIYPLSWLQFINNSFYNSKYSTNRQVIFYKNSLVQFHIFLIQNELVLNFLGQTRLLIIFQSKFIPSPQLDNLSCLVL